MQNGFFTFRAYSIAVLTLAAGIGLSFHQEDWNWFSRSGSLIVINGIVLTSHQIIEHIRNLTRAQQYQGSQFKRDWAGMERKHFLYEDHLSRWISEKCGLYLLVLGTLVWGFGDLAGLIVQ